MNDESAISDVRSDVTCPVCGRPGNCCQTRDEVERLRGERDEMRRANITPEDAERPLGQSVEYWQDRCLDHATALDESRVRVRELEAEVERLRVLDDPEAMAAATEALQVSADMPHNQRAAYIIRAAIERRSDIPAREDQP